MDPLTGKISKRETLKSVQGRVILKSPPYPEDIAVRLIRK